MMLKFCGVYRLDMNCSKIPSRWSDYVCFNSYSIVTNIAEFSEIRWIPPWVDTTRKGRYGDTRSTHSSQEKLLFSEYMFEAMVLAEVSVRSHVESIYSTCTLQQFQLDCEIASKSWFLVYVWMYNFSLAAESEISNFRQNPVVHVYIPYMNIWSYQGILNMVG